MVALISAGLFLRSLQEAYQANPGFDPHHVLLVSFDPFLSGYDEARGREFYRHLVEPSGLFQAYNRRLWRAACP